MAIELLFEIGYGVGSVVEDGGGQRGIRFAFAENADEIVEESGGAAESDS